MNHTEIANHTRHRKSTLHNVSPSPYIFKKDAMNHVIAMWPNILGCVKYLKSYKQQFLKHYHVMILLKIWVGNLYIIYNPIIS